MVSFIYMLYCIIYEELVTGMPPFYDQDVQVMYTKIMSANLVIPSTISPELAQFCTKALKRDPNERISTKIRLFVF